MNIGRILIWPQDTHPKIVANGVVTLDEVVDIKFTLFKGPKGLFLGLPGRYADKVNPETGKKTWYQDVRITNEQFRTEVTQKIIQAYSDTVNGGATTQGEAPEAGNQSTDSCPF